MLRWGFIVTTQPYLLLNHRSHFASDNVNYSYRNCVAIAVLLWAVMGLGLADCNDLPVEPVVEEAPEVFPPPPAAVDLSFDQGVNAFAFDLARQLVERSPDENVAFSPLSVSMALGLLLNGAEGATFEAISRTLRFGGLDLDSLEALVQ